MGLGGRKPGGPEGSSEVNFSPKTLSAGKFAFRQQAILPELGRPVSGVARLLCSRSGQGKHYNCLLRTSDREDRASVAELELAREAISSQRWVSRRGEHKYWSSSLGDKGDIVSASHCTTATQNNTLKFRSIPELSRLLCLSYKSL